MRRQQGNNNNSYLLAFVFACLLATVDGFAPSNNHARSTTSFAQSTFVKPATPLTTTKTSNAVVPSSKSALQMSAASVPAIGFSAIAGCISGGLFAGGLHAIAGPDHLAALLPRCCGQRWYRAGRVGALWGMGHGVSATILGLTAFALKSTLNSLSTGSAIKKFLSGASHVTEIAVGLSLVLIGIMGIKEAREWQQEPAVQSLSAAAADGGVTSMKQAQKRAVIFNGLLHGFSWDGAPSLAPAVAVATWGGSLTFLTSYAVGTMTAMAITTTLIGEGTRKAGQFMNRPDIPQKLSMFSSWLAIAIGAVWCGLAFA